MTELKPATYMVEGEITHNLTQEDSNSFFTVALKLNISPPHNNLHNHLFYSVYTPDKAS